MVLFLSMLSGLISVAATYFWFRRYISGRNRERFGETLARDSGDVGLSAIAELLPVSWRRIWNALIIAFNTAFVGLFHWCSVWFWMGPPQILMSCFFYAFTLTLWAAFLMFPAQVAGEVVLRHRAAKDQ